ncbi:MAG TPA: HAMP domain-containing protein [Synechococcales cyanobacterium M55_K2018_004]|nr:HAMP domain-containing protein [Synechococcales cyanobacterium M55_K2018_004]
MTQIACAIVATSTSVLEGKVFVMNSLQVPPKLQKKKNFFSLRWRLLIGFTLVFTSVFAGAYYWFYAYTTEKAITRLKEDLRNTALGVAEGVDVEELLALYQEGDRNAEGYSDDPRYHRQLSWFQTSQSIAPNVYPYTFIIGKPEQNRRIGNMDPEVKPGGWETIYLVDILWKTDLASRALPFLTSGSPSEYALRAFQAGKTTDRDLYTDEWGSWISTYTPLRDKTGKVVAVLGADIEADYVIQVQHEIRDQILVAFGITYSTLFVLVFIVSGVFTKPLNRLTHAAENMSEGNYDQDLSGLTKSKVEDEISTLAHVFEIMVSKVRQREESLKQQVADLKIEIDQAKRQKQVSEIVDTDFFQDLVAKARKMRSKAGRVPEATVIAEASGLAGAVPLGEEPPSPETTAFDTVITGEPVVS